MVSRVSSSQDAQCSDSALTVTDRLGWLNYVHGSLSSNLASKVDTARSPFKAYRDAENALAPRRNLRTGLETQIDRIVNEHRKDQLAKLPELQAQLKKMEDEDEPAEKELELLMRKAVRESEQLKWEAVREVSIFWSSTPSISD